MKIQFYWFSNLALPVKFLGKLYLWKKLYGVMLGNCFIGIIKGYSDKEIKKMLKEVKNEKI